MILSVISRKKPNQEFHYFLLSGRVDRRYELYRNFSDYASNLKSYLFFLSRH